MTVTVSNLNFPWPVGHTTIGGPENSKVVATTEILSSGGIVIGVTAFLGGAAPAVGDGISVSYTASNFTNIGNHQWSWSNGQISGLGAGVEYSIRAWAHSSQVGNVKYYYGPLAHVTTTPYTHVAPTCDLTGGVTNVVPGGSVGGLATLHGRVTDNGSGGDPSVTITQRGYVMGTAPNPTLANSKFVVSNAPSGVSVMPAFTTQIILNVYFYYRAFATNSAGITGYSPAYAPGSGQGPFGVFANVGVQAGEVDAGFHGIEIFTPPPPPLKALAVIQADLRAWLSMDRGAVLGNRALHRATSQRDHEPRQRGSDEQLAIVNAMVRDTGGDGIIITPPPPPPPDGTPKFWHAAPTDGKVHIPFTYTWAALGPPLPTLAISGDAIPGLTFTPGASGNGTLAGTPTTAGTYTVTVTATNANGSTSVTNQIVIAPGITPPPPGSSLLGWNGDAGEFPTVETELGFHLKGGWTFIGTTHPSTLEDILITWEGDTTHDLMFPVGMCPNSITYKQGIAGAADQHWKDVAQLFLTYHRPAAIVRFGWEFNQPNHFNWAYDKAGNASAWADYVAYYRRIVSLMRGVAPNLRTIYNPGMGNWGIQGTGADWYPGDDVISYVGLDFYDQIFPSYPASNATAWNYYLSGNVTGRTAGWGLNWLKTFAATHHKPILIPEIGPGFSANTGQNGHDDGFAYLMTQLHQWATDNSAYMVIAAVGGPTARANFPTKFPLSFATLRAAWA